MKRSILILCFGALLVSLQAMAASAQERHWQPRSIYSPYASRIGQPSIESPSIGGRYANPNLGDPSYAPQFHRVESLIYDWYVSYLGRRPQRSEIDHWVEFVNYRGTLPEARIGIMASPECFERCQNDPQIYVQFLFTQLTGRQPSSRELQTWVSLLHQRFQGERRDFCRALVANLE